MAKTNDKNNKLHEVKEVIQKFTKALFQEFQ